MSQAIDRVGLSPNYAPQQKDGPQAEAVGARQGDKVVLKEESIQSLVEKSMEELPSHLSEKTSRKLAERTAKSKSSSRILEIANKYVTAKDKPDQAERFEKAANALKKIGKPTPEQLKQLLNDNFGGDHSAALMFLEEAFSGDPADADILKTIRDVKAEVGAQLQSFVREELAAFESAGEVYSSLAGQHSPQEFMAAADLMIKKLGGDIHAQGSSTDIVQIKSTLDTLYHLELARNTFSTMSDLTNRMQTSFGEKWQDGPHRLMRDVLPLKEQRWLDGTKVRTTVDKLGISTAEAKIYMMRELYTVFSKLPDKAYTDHEARLRMTGAVQEALDVAIREEEA
ncbi:MAG TPA: TyeA family type III secretion system gatekeeper subunit [Caulifigura sp.]|jgi:type III secretion system TyeA family effector delivery regulator|nr:TyeA family type III secretion system gatekeeper subunit [Caulifigura sp.]